METTAHAEGRTPAETDHLFEHLEDVARELDHAGRWSLLLDFDGTLAPIAERPDLARIPEATRSSLRELAVRPGGLVAILSGRAIDDVRSLVGLESLYYAGNHGLEIAGPGGVYFEEPTACVLRDRLADRTRDLRRRIEDLPGVEVEAKGLTTSVHYRRADPGLWEAVGDRVAAIVPPGDPSFAIHAGKCVHEVRPRAGWGKGHAAAWLLRRLGRAGDIPLFLGDDLTDEDVFIALSERGVTARVGPFVRTHARYRVDGTEEVARCLSWLVHRERSRHEPASTSSH